MTERMHLEVDQSEIDWTPGQTPTITGKINSKPWRASFLKCSDWTFNRQSGDGLTTAEIQAVKLYLESMTPSYVDRTKARKTTICAAAILTLIGVGAAATIVALVKRHHKLKKS